MSVGKRCAAVVLDAAAVVGVALALFVALGTFWTSLAIASVCYYAGATLFLGSSPAVRLLTARAHWADAVGPYDLAADLPVYAESDPYFDGIGAIASVSDPLSSS